MSFFPTVIHSTFTSFSGEIEVLEVEGRRRLVVGHLVQSVNKDYPGIWEKVWGQLLNFPYPLKSNPTVLILGLGGGTVAHLANRKFLPSKIMAVEIDPSIIEIARKFFALAEIKNLEVANRDAFDFIKDDLAERWDLVVVDIYAGQSFPFEALRPEFYRNLKEKLNLSGIISINRIFHDDQKSERQEFTRLLMDVFGKVSEKFIESPVPTKNYLYYAQKL